MDEERERLIEDALEAHKEAITAMQSAATPVWQLDLTMAQFKGLSALSREEPITIGQFAEKLSIGRPAASILIERLVELGLVERTEDSIDRRRTFARLSPSGEELLTRLRQGGRERIRSWFGRMSNEELASLAYGLRGLVAAAAAERLRANS